MTLQYNEKKWLLIFASQNPNREVLNNCDDRMGSGGDFSFNDLRKLIQEYQLNGHISQNIYTDLEIIEHCLNENYDFVGGNGKFQF